MVTLYSPSVQICLEIFCLGLGGAGNYLLLEVKIILNGWFVPASHMLRVCLMAMFGVTEEFPPHLGTVVSCVPCHASVLRADPLLHEPLAAPRSIARDLQHGTAPACTSHTGNLQGLHCFGCFLPQHKGCWYHLPTLCPSMHCSCRVAGE